MRVRECSFEVDQASIATVCDKDEIKWPLVAARNFRFLPLARDILLGPKFSY